MARPRTQTVEYFPHYASSGKTMFILENKYQNDGYAFWFKLLEMLATSEGHQMRLDNTVDFEYLMARTKVNAEKATDILNTLAGLDAIDRELWENDKIIWVQHFVDNLADVYSKRTVDAPTRPQSKKQAKEPDPEQDPEPLPEPATKTGKEKIRYADKVNMTEEEYDKLIGQYGEARTKGMIQDLSNWKCSKGKQTKSDFHTILAWIRREEKEAEARKAQGSGTKYKPTGNFCNFEQRDYDFDDLEQKLLDSTASTIDKGFNAEKFLEKFKKKGTNQQPKLGLQE